MPLGLLLYYLFGRSRSYHLNQIAEEEKKIMRNTEVVNRDKPAYDLLMKKLLDGFHFNGLNPSDLIKALYKNYSDAEKEIRESQMYINRVKNSSFIDWVAFHFTKSYFESYFSKN